MSPRNLVLASEALNAASEALTKSARNSQAMVQSSAALGTNPNNAYGSACGSLKNAIRTALAYLNQARGRLYGSDSVTAENLAHMLGFGLAEANRLTDERDWEGAYSHLLNLASVADMTIRKLRVQRKAGVVA